MSFDNKYRAHFYMQFPLTESNHYLVSPGFPLMAVRDKRRRLELACLLLGTIVSASLIFGHRLGSMYTSAGHVSGFLMNGSGEIDRALESSGPPLGLFPDSNFVTSTIPVTSKHLMILLTDGTTEMATSGDVEFGAGGVLEYVRAHRQDSTLDLVNGIFQAARSFAGDHPQQDDATGVIVRVT